MWNSTGCCILSKTIQNHLLALLIVFICVQDMPHPDQTEFFADCDATDSAQTTDPVEGVVPNGDSVIYADSDVTKNHLALLLMSIAIRHNLTSACLQDLLTLLNVIAPGCVPKTNYYIDKLCRFSSHNVERHYYYSNCHFYFGAVLVSVCEKCKTVCSGKSDSSYMLVLPIEDQLRDLLEQNDCDRFIFTEGDRDTNIKHDVINGKMYGQLKSSSNVTLQFNCDGAAISKSSAFSIWPLTCTINELPVDIRNKHHILQTLWFGSSKPPVHTFKTLH
jgi:hypothetical protein